MPGKVKVRVLAGRNLPVMDRSSDTTDAYVEVKLGSTTYKTDVCRKSLHPQWDSDWFRYEVDDSELQDEPLQIRLMDHDTYSANDAIGKVYVDLNPLLLPPSGTSSTSQHHPNTTNTDSGHTNVQAVQGGGGTMMSGWIPVYDTMHGIRGEVNVVIKVELFSDFNKFRQSSCGIQFFCSGSIPEGHVVSRLQGLVGELVVEGDPEHQWIDKIRTPRASNEARQALFFKLSGELRRRIGLKAIELGANAVLGYQQYFDLEGETGIVVRGIGTAATLAKLQPPQPIQQHHSPSPSPSPSPANHVINTGNQGLVDVSYNSIYRNLCPPVTASPRSQRQNQFNFLPSSPGSPRRYTSSISQSGIFSGTNGSSVISGSPNQLAITGYGVANRNPSEETTPKDSYLRVADSKESISQSSKSSKDWEDEDGKEMDSDSYKSRKKLGISSERRSLGERLRAVKLLPKTVHEKLSRLWNNGGTNFSSASTNLYRRSVSDSTGINEQVNHNFTKLETVADDKEDEPRNIFYNEALKEGNRMLLKPNSYPGTTIHSTGPVEITVQSPGEEFIVSESFSNDCSDANDKIDIPHHTQEDVVTHHDKNSNSGTEKALSKFPVKDSYSTLESVSDLKFESDSYTSNCGQNLRIQMVINETVNEKFSSENIMHIDREKSFPENTAASENNSECSLTYNLDGKTSAAVQQNIVDSYEKQGSSITTKIGDSSIENNLAFSDNNAHVLPETDEDQKVIKSVLTISLNSSDSCFASKGTLPIDGRMEIFQNSLQSPQHDCLDCNKMSNYALKNTKSDSYISEMTKGRSGNTVDSTLYEEDIIAQVCQLEELINQRSSQSPRSRQHSFNYDDEEFSSDYSLKAPTLEVSSWQEEENLEREESRSELTYSDGHLYSNLSSSDEDDDSSSCLSYSEDLKLDDDLPECEQIKKGKTKKFLNTLAPKKLVSGCKSKRIKTNIPQEKSVSSNPPIASTSGEKKLSSKGLMKDFQKKLVPIKMKLSIKDKTPSLEEEKNGKPLTSLPDVKNSKSLQSPSGNIVTTETIDNDSPLLTFMEDQAMDGNSSETLCSYKVADNKDLPLVSEVKDLSEKTSSEMNLISSIESSPEIKGNSQLNLGNNILEVKSLESLSSTQTVLSKTKSSGMLECAGNAALPIHASPSSSTSSTSTLQCLCRTPAPGSNASEKPGSSPPSSGCQIKKNAGSTTDSHPCLHRRSSDSDLSVTPKGSSGGVGGSSRDSTGNSSQWYHQSGSYPAGGYPYHPYHGHGSHWGPHHLPNLHHPLMGRAPGGGTSNAIAPDPLDMAEYPFLTMTSYPPGFLLHLAGTVSARSVKLLGSGGDSGGGGGGGDEEAWEQRDAWWTEVRMEIRSHARALACDVVIAYSEKTSICDDVCVLSSSGTAAVINPNYFYHGVGVEDGLRGFGSSHQYQGPHRELMTSSLDRTDFERERGVTLVASTMRVRNTSESREVGEEKGGGVGSLGGTASSASPPRNPTPIPLASTQPCTTGAVNFPSCSVCHIPYGPSTVPFRINMAKCALCRRGCVPDVLLATCEPPEGLATIGVGTVIQAYASRGRRGEGYGGGGSGSGGGMGGGGVVGVGVGSSGSSRGEISAKDISDGLPFLEYDLHRALANKLRLCGMNAVFGLKVEVKVGERLLVAVATGTGVLVAALPRPTVPCIRPQAILQSGQVSGNQAAQADALQKNLEETVKRCKETFLLDPPKVSRQDTSWTNGVARNGNSDTDDSGEDELQHTLPQLDLSAGNKDTCVLEVDDDQDAEAIALLVAGPPLPPKGFHVAATERIPGLCYCPNPPPVSSSQIPSQHPTCFSCLRPSPSVDPKAPLRVVRNLQMFTQLWRAKLSPPPSGSVINLQHSGSGTASSSSSGNPPMSHGVQGTSSTSQSLGPPSTITLHFNRLLQSIFFKLRKMAPCALANLTFRVDLPEPEEIQLYVVGMALGLGERPPRRQRVHTSGGSNRESSRKADDSEMIFSLEEEEEISSKDPPHETSTPKANAATSAKGWIPFFKSNGPRWARWPLLGERHGIDVTPLSYIPGGRIQRYLGNLNFFFIRESTCIREAGGLSGFVQSFMTEVLCIVRAHARALGGNALVAFSIVECVLLHNPHKNQGQSLINVSGDVVYASYEQE